MSEENYSDFCNKLVDKFDDMIMKDIEDLNLSNCANFDIILNVGTNLHMSLVQSLLYDDISPGAMRLLFYEINSHMFNIQKDIIEKYDIKNSLKLKNKTGLHS